MAGQHCEFFGGWNAKNTYVAEFLEISMTQTFRNPENIPRSMLRFFRLMEKKSFHDNVMKGLNNWHW